MQTFRPSRSNSYPIISLLLWGCGPFNFQEITIAIGNTVRTTKITQAATSEMSGPSKVPSSDPEFFIKNTSVINEQISEI